MILYYLIENLITEERFTLVKPDNYKFYGIEGVDVQKHDNGSALVQCVAPYIFVFNENLFDMQITTDIIYPLYSSKEGKVGYLVSGSKIKPIFVSPSNEKIELTDENIQSNEIVSSFIKANSEKFIALVNYDFSYDISEEDPSYDPSKSFETMNKDSVGGVFRKLNNVAYIVKDYTINFDKYVASKIEKKVFGHQYSIFTSLLRYKLNIIEFAGKQDYEGDTRRFNIYQKWFDAVSKNYGNVVQTNIDGVNFEYIYQDTFIA